MRLADHFPGQHWTPAELVTCSTCLLAIVALTTASPPVAIAQGAADSTAVVSWIAPGDDGDEGMAARYDLRYRTVPIADGDTLSWWNAATPVAGLPAPSPAGVPDSVVVTGLDRDQTVYFVLRVADEVPNWSGFSNVAVLEPRPDVTPPAAIQDLEATNPPAGASGPEPPSSHPPPPPEP